MHKQTDVAIKLESKYPNKYISITITPFTPPLLTLTNELNKLANVTNGGVNGAMVIEIDHKQITHLIFI